MQTRALVPHHVAIKFKDEQPANLVNAKSLFSAPFKYLTDISYKHKPTMMSYELIKRMARSDVIAQAIISTRVNQVAQFARPQRSPFDMGYKLRLRDNMGGKTSAKSEGEKVRALMNMILNTSVVDKAFKRDDFEVFLRKIVRDSMTYDQAAVEVVNTAGGEPYEWYAIDASTIRLSTHPWEMERPDIFDFNNGIVPTKPNELDWSGYLNEMKQSDLLTSTAKYVQVFDGAIINEYSEYEMGFLIRNAETDLSLNGYGISELEYLVHHVTAQLFQEQYNRYFFRQGSAIKGIVSVPMNVPREMLEAFKREWYAQVSGVINAWRTPVIKADKLNFIPMHTNNRDMEWSEWSNYLVRCHGSIFAIDPYEFGFDIKTGTGPSQNAPLFESSNESKVKWSKDRGLKPLLRSVERLVNQNIIWRIDDRFELELVGLDAKSEKEAIDIRVTEGKAYKTLDEIRADAELPALGKEAGGDMIMGTEYLQWHGQEQQAKQQEQMQQQQMQQQQMQGQGQGGEGEEGAPGQEGQPGQEQPQEGDQQEGQEQQGEQQQEQQGGQGQEGEEDQDEDEQSEEDKKAEEEYRARIQKSEGVELVKIDADPWRGLRD